MRLGLWNGLIIVALLTGLPAPATGASSLPKWAAAIAADAPPVRSDSEDWRVLLSETRLSIKADGTLRIKRVLAAQAQRERLQKLRIGYFHHDDDSRARRTPGAPDRTPDRGPDTP